jgi:PncC family amidohydrolase
MENELAERVILQLGQQHQTLCTAESCTGGRIAAALTSVPGASEVFLGSVVAYANSAKQNLLGIDQAIIAEFGAVSESVAKQMALGARQRFGADFAVATTGIAGPGGATPGKPVGLVWLAWATRHSVNCASFNFAGTRDAVQTQAVHKALLGIMVRL